MFLFQNHKHTHAHAPDLRNLPKALDDGSVVARSAPSIYVRAREARPLAVLAQCARSECLHLERAPGARSIGEEFFETTILVIELQKCVKIRVFTFTLHILGSRLYVAPLCTACRVRLRAAPQLPLLLL